MTVTTTVSSVSYTGNGAAQNFTGTFPMLSPNDLSTTVAGVSVLATVTGDVTQSGWNARMPTIPANGAAILMKRVTPLQQLTSYMSYGQYQAKQHESDYDYSMYILQELQRDSVFGIGGPAVAPIAAAQVTFTPAGTLESTNVQAAIQELDADISTRFHEVGSNSVVTRGDATLAMGSTLSGGALYDSDGTAVAGWTKADGVLSAKAQSVDPSAFTRKDYVDSIFTPALSFVSGNIPITAAQGSVTNPLNTKRIIYTATLININAAAQGGYAQFEEVLLPLTTSTNSFAGFSVSINAAGTQFSYSHTGTVQITDKGSGGPFTITLANWNLVVRAFKIP